MTVVAGPVSVEPPHGVTLVPVVTAAEMQRAMSAAAEHADVVLMAAAVADYRPAKVSREKLKRSADPLTIKLEPNPDILAGLGAARRPGQVLVGFALETSDGVSRARAKLKAKRVDLIALNSPADGIGGNTNRVTLVDAARTLALPLADKLAVAEALLDRVLELRAGAMAPSRAAKPKRGRSAGKAPAKRGKGRKRT